MKTVEVVFVEGLEVVTSLEMFAKLRGAKLWFGTFLWNQRVCLHKALGLLGREKQKLVASLHSPTGGGGCPFGGKAGQSGGFVRAKGRLRSGLLQMGAVQHESQFHVVEQLADEHGGRRRTVILHALPDVADVKAFAGRKERLEE